ncbi:concanavalin A-like lectin/glucanase [Cryphonectria parasitica EP155]|uniref:Concanavalin A-like lectin/glucanase n=1 Tax=Cryphonectria parasitica (strain ATCC 38755 / EP155) TaxID=660469 RepID=A0A9P4YAU9_CRYP1|nr:concanavalin A-like lectin/glucanase [Cryphonectria parasitica EP155]KAF3769966.1 concanavalin A-like lectin/glucanase [Cryphonectria parasitica EP155]
MRSLLAILVGLSPAAAQQFLVNELSFGYNNKISPNNDGSIPSFSLQGNPNTPEILSNKIILTPPAPGNQRSAVWADQALQHIQWTADVDFRANGPERAGGNLNIWLVKDGAQDVGTSSIYTVGKFEGLALVIDTYGGSAGMVRGFLNDGTKDYSKISVDGQSFGHCDHAYRNLGRPSQIKFRQTMDNFKVEIDGQLCFESNRISIPAGYKLGLTAASADNPDSFEIFKMVVMTENFDPARDKHTQQVLSQDSGSAQAQDGGLFGQAQDPPAAAQGGSAGSSGNFDSAFDDDIAEADAGSITSSGAQFADLHTRLQSVNRHTSSIFRKLAKNDIIGETRHSELAGQIGELKSMLSKLNKLDDMEKKISSLEGEIRKLKGDVSSKVSNMERSIKNLVSDTHSTLNETVKAHAAPGHGRLIAVIVGSQIVMAVGYILYKRRKSSPKKYL